MSEAYLYIATCVSRYTLPINFCACQGVRMNKILSTALLTVTLTLSSAVANAEEGSAMAPKPAPAAAAPAAKPAMSNHLGAMFDKLDKNHDGMIDKKEAKADKYLSRAFRKIAKNGKLDKDGYSKWEEKRHHKSKHKAKVEKKS